MYIILAVVPCTQASKQAFSSVENNPQAPPAAAAAAARHSFTV
jgi:hypothetical protein